MLPYHCTFQNEQDQHVNINEWLVNWKTHRFLYGHHNQQNQPNLIFYHFVNICISFMNLPLNNNTAGKCLVDLCLSLQIFYPFDL